MYLYSTCISEAPVDSTEKSIECYINMRYFFFFTHRLELPFRTLFVFTSAYQPSHPSRLVSRCVFSRTRKNIKRLTDRSGIQHFLSSYFLALCSLNLRFHEWLTCSITLAAADKN
jgi:hypothetical protein